MVEATRKQNVVGYVLSAEAVILLGKLDLELGRAGEVGIGFLVLVAAHENGADVVETDALLSGVLEV